MLQKRRHRPEEVQKDAEGHLLDFHQGITMKWGASGDVEFFKRGGFNFKDCEPTPDGDYSTFTKD